MIEFENYISSGERFMKHLLLAVSVAATLVLGGVRTVSAQDALVIEKDSVFYVGVHSPTTVSAFDASTGEFIWSNSLATLCPGGQLHPAVMKDVVYVGCETSSGGGVAALRADNGQVLWYTSLAQVYSSPTPEKDVIYLGSQTGVVAVDANTGAIRWLTYLGVVGSSPVVQKGVVYVGANGGANDYLTALDTTTGQILYQVVAP